MKQSIFILLFLALIVAVSGCGGGDAKFSPDPSIGAQPGGDAPPPPDGGTGDGGAGQGGENTSQNKSSQERDCFLDGFCYRVCRTAAECPEGFSCIMNVCTYDCQTDSECGTGVFAIRGLSANRSLLRLGVSQMPIVRQDNTVARLTVASSFPQPALHAPRI